MQMPLFVTKWCFLTIVPWRQICHKIVKFVQLSQTTIYCGFLFDTAQDVVLQYTMKNGTQNLGGQS